MCTRNGTTAEYVNFRQKRFWKKTNLLLRHFFHVCDRESSKNDEDNVHTFLLLGENPP